MVGAGAVYDVNSMYPWAMRNMPLPCGEPVYFEGKYQGDKYYPLYVQCMKAAFKLKPGKYPSIQLKSNPFYPETEYILDTGGNIELMTLTSVDVALLFENYFVSDIEYIAGYKFHSKTGAFEKYIDYWYHIKEESAKSGNSGMKYIAKLMLNSLYGKFGTNPKKGGKYPYLDEDGIVKYLPLMPEVINGGYIPVATFITSYARDKIIRAANACGDRFLYADTDSLHVLGDDPPNIEIDEYKLGAFKLEDRFVKAKYLRAKCYIEQTEDGMIKKCAGLPKGARDEFDFDSMVSGSKFDGKLVPKNIKGGVVLIDRGFTLK